MLVDLLADDLGQLIEKLGLKKPADVGQSWGGNIGTILASDPQLISRAFLEDPVYWRMIHAFVTSLPGALARRSRAEASAGRKYNGAVVLAEKLDEAAKSRVAHLMKAPDMSARLAPDFLRRDLSMAVLYLVL